MGHEIRVINIKKDKETTDYLYIGRANKYLGLEASKWANPFPMKNEAQRPEVLRLYELHIRSRPDLIAALPELRGRTLGCFCAPRNCHGHVLIKLLEEFYPESLEVTDQDIQYLVGKLYDIRKIIAKSNTVPKTSFADQLQHDSLLAEEESILRQIKEIKACLKT